jgi:hypothetical protein
VFDALTNNGQACVLHRGAVHWTQPDLSTATLAVRPWVTANRCRAKRAITPDGWFATGYVGVVDEDGWAIAGVAFTRVRDRGATQRNRPTLSRSAKRMLRSPCALVSSTPGTPCAPVAGALCRREFLAVVRKSGIGGAPIVREVLAASSVRPPVSSCCVAGKGQKTHRS